MSRKKNEPQWGPNAINTLHPGFGVETTTEVRVQGVQRYVRIAVESGYRVIYDDGTAVSLERIGHTKAANGVGVGFLLGGVLGAGLGAALAKDRVERIQIWSDSHGAIYARSI